MKKVVIGIVVIIGLFFCISIFSGIISAAKQDKQMVQDIRREIEAVAPIKSAVERYYRTHSKFPKSYTDLGSDIDIEKILLKSGNIKEFSIYPPGVINIELGESLQYGKMIFTPNTNSGSIKWICRGSNNG